MTTTTVPTVRPDEPGYDELRLGFQAHRPQRPAVVVPARDAGDVAAAVRLARADGRRLAVQATGHGVGATDPDAVLVATGALRGVTVDPDARTTRVEAGATWGDVIAATAPHGLAPLSGSTSRVGVVGYLLSGGVPLLGRRHGFAAAGVRSFEVVTAAGESLTVPAAGDGLGWALRGGGGSFAVVTAVTVDLVASSGVFGGSVFLPVDGAPDTVRRWRDLAAEVPDETTTSLAVIPFPDLDAVPPPLRGRTVISIRVIHDGPDGDAAVAPFAALGEPIAGEFGEVAWPASDSIHRDPPGPAPSVSTNVALHELPDDAVTAALAAVGGDGPRRVLELRRLGGALTRPTGLPLRHDAEWNAGTVTIAPTQADADAAAPRDTGLRGALAPYTVGRLANFLFDEGADPAAVESAYDAGDFARLRAIKSEVDPDDVLLAAAPIPPLTPARRS